MMMEFMDMFFIGVFMIINGICGGAFLYEIKWTRTAAAWAAFWCAPPLLKLWFSAVIGFIG